MLYRPRRRCARRPRVLLPMIRSLSESRSSRPLCWISICKLTAGPQGLKPLQCGDRFGRKRSRAALEGQPRAAVPTWKVAAVPPLKVAVVPKLDLLELDVGAEGGDEDGTAVAVVAGVVDVLQAGCDIDAAPDVEGVVGLQNIFAAVVQLAVAEEKTEAAIGEVGLVVLLDGVRYKSDSCAILLTMPPGAVRAQSAIYGLIDFGVSEGFGLAVIPAYAGESGEVAG